MVSSGENDVDGERWLVVDGRRWRRTDPVLPAAMVEALKSHLGRGRNAVRAAKRTGDADEMAEARARVGLAKHGLGERGVAWWDAPEGERIERARAALAELDERDEAG
ncbi:biopolymer transporter Tol [Herbiconiux sp. YIM B11900]|uniref:biopolymer transporter Tol n=1 Tax=Herbiconiux sp. YIM B11900 TaxID=3404131 RepID=UPI003F828D5B